MSLAHAEDGVSRAIARLGVLALRVRRPARRICGSLRAAVVAVAALLGAYLLAEGSMYVSFVWTSGFTQLVYISGSLAFIGALGNIAIVTGILGWGRFASSGVLTRLLCARLALAVTYLPLSPICMVYATVTAIRNGVWAPAQVFLWEMVCFGGTAILAALLYSLLHELHGSKEESGGGWMTTQSLEATASSIAVEDPTPGPAPPPRRPH